mmetsp:Transcript_6089/g.14285  ORF Transcript_6089/g.14285 Transcript_6089/m.14285 type:complete len:323 (+) Transcript_6089:126-1094(+)
MLLHVNSEAPRVNVPEGCCSGHSSSGAMGARLPGAGLSLATHDVRASAHASRDDPHLPRFGAGRPFPRDPQLLLLPLLLTRVEIPALLTFAVVVVNVYHFAPNTFTPRFLLHHLCKGFHHKTPVLPGIGLAEGHVCEVLLALRRLNPQVGEGLATSSALLGSQLVVVLSCHIADVARPAVQHHPNAVLLIIDELHKMVAATECAQLPCVLATQRLPYPASRRMLRDQHLYSGLHGARASAMRLKAGGDGAPEAPLDGQQPLLGEVLPQQATDWHSTHATAYVYPDCVGTNEVPRREDGANRSPFAQVHVRHCCHEANCDAAA